VTFGCGEVRLLVEGVIEAFLANGAGETVLFGLRKAVEVVAVVLAWLGRATSATEVPGG
jgi:hypothetical protein